MAQLWGTPDLVVDRYFAKSYSIDIKDVPGQDQCILQHSNKVCVVCIAPSHALLTSKPVSVDFQVNEKTDRSASKVRGKRKRGGQWLTAYSPLCKVQCEDGKEYIIYSCIRGDLLEVNETLVENPSLLSSWPQSNGYIAVILPKHHERQNVMGKLLSAEQYEEAMEKRKLMPEDGSSPTGQAPSPSSMVPMATGTEAQGSGMSSDAATAPSMDTQDTTPMQDTTPTQDVPSTAPASTAGE
eukprot:scpid72152/ scgid12232/ Protein FAM206A